VLQGDCGNARRNGEMVHWRVKLPALMLAAIGVAASVGWTGFGFFW
jgi:hypothetical protein